MRTRQKIRIKFILIIALAILSGLISYPKAVSKIPPVYDALNKLKINLGLDLQGGIHLEYKADVSDIEELKIEEALQAAQDVIERRVNAFGVGEPLVQTAFSGGENRIIVELPGIKNIEEAKKKIKDTPFLEFKEEKTEEEMKEMDKMFDSVNEQAKKQAEEVLGKVNPPAGGGGNFEELAKEFSQDPGSKETGGDLGFVKKGNFVPEFDKILFEENLQDGEIYPELVETQYGWHIIKKNEERIEGEEKEVRASHILLGKQNSAMYPDLKYKSTGLTGKNLENASVGMQGQVINEITVDLQFDAEGEKMFTELTKRNIGKTVAIYLDNEIINAPTVQAEISGGKAVITGDFTREKANNLVQGLNEGALPVPLELVAQQSVEASLGEVSLQKSLKAGAVGLVLVVIFMVVYYRYLGLIASMSLLIYAGLMVAVFKIFHITLTLPGIAGFILSIGMAVDANILIFERTKEEIKKGRNVISAIDEGFRRAWTSIFDGNVSSLITAAILMSIGTGFVKGFAVTLFLGVLISMFTAMTVSKTLIKILVGEWVGDRLWLVGVKSSSVDKNENKK